MVAAEAAPAPAHDSSLARVIRHDEWGYDGSALDIVASAALALGSAGVFARLVVVVVAVALFHPAGHSCSRAAEGVGESECWRVVDSNPSRHPVDLLEALEVDETMLPTEVQGVRQHQPPGRLVDGCLVAAEQDSDRRIGHFVEGSDEL